MKKEISKCMCELGHFMRENYRGSFYIAGVFCIIGITSGILELFVSELIGFTNALGYFMAVFLSFGICGYTFDVIDLI